MSLVLLLGILFPRIAVVFAAFMAPYLFSNVFLAILGWIFLPYTLLAWVAIQFWFGGLMTAGPIALLVAGVIADVGFPSYCCNNYRKI